MEQFKEFDFDNMIYATAAESILTNTAEKIEMLTQEYQALKATLLRQHPGDDSDAVRHTREQVERQYHTLVSQFHRNHAYTGLQPPPLHV